MLQAWPARARRREQVSVMMGQTWACVCWVVLHPVPTAVVSGGPYCSPEQVTEQASPGLAVLSGTWSQAEGRWSGCPGQSTLSLVASENSW